MQAMRIVQVSGLTNYQPWQGRRRPSVRYEDVRTAPTPSLHPQVLHGREPSQAGVGSPVDDSHRPTLEQREHPRLQDDGARPVQGPPLGLHLATDVMVADAESPELMPTHDPVLSECELAKPGDEIKGVRASCHDPTVTAHQFSPYGAGSAAVDETGHRPLWTPALSDANPVE